MKLPDTVAVMTLPGATLFPQALLRLHIFEPRYRQMLADTLRADRMFSVAMQQPGRSRETPCAIAGLGFIRVSVEHTDGTSHLILQGLTRVELQEPVRLKPYRVHAIEPLATPPADTVKVEALSAKVRELARCRLKQGALPLPLAASNNSGHDPTKNGGASKQHSSVRQVIQSLERLPDAEKLADLVTWSLLPDALQRQTILESLDVENRLQHLIHFLMEEIRSARKNSPK